MTEYPRRRGEVVQSAGEDGWTIYEPETDSLHVLNTSAKAIWDLCDGQTSAEEMANAVAELTGLPEDSARLDVDLTLERLKESGLLAKEDPAEAD